MTQPDQYFPINKPDIGSTIQPEVSLAFTSLQAIFITIILPGWKYAKVIQILDHKRYGVQEQDFRGIFTSEIPFLDRWLLPPLVANVPK